MRRIPLVQIGVGGVGRALVEQVLYFNEQIGSRLGVRFAYVALADRHGAIVADERIPPAVLRTALHAKASGASLADVPEGGPLNDWRNLLTPLPCIVIDVTAQNDAETGLAEAVANGHRVVLANKKPLCADLHVFRALTNGGRTRYEATVGAGLPVISTLRSLLDTGDRVRSITGCFSGTLGYLTTELEAEQAFSAIVRDAMQRGWTEPDPRDDLSGMDVARKALILARTAGASLALGDIAVERLFGDDLANVGLHEFLEQMSSLDAPFADRFAAAQAAQAALRYVARVDVAAAQASVGYAALSRAEETHAPFTSLRGVDNLIAFQTQRYHAAALTIRGPGAGVQVTASAVLHDLIEHARAWS